MSKRNKVHPKRKMSKKQKIMIWTVSILMTMVLGYIIDDVMEAAMAGQAIQDNLESKWESEKIEIDVTVSKTEEEVFYEKFWEVWCLMVQNTTIQWFL